VEVSALLDRGLDQLGRCIVAGLGLAEWCERTPAIWTPGQRADVAEAMACLPDRTSAAVRALRRLLEMPREAVDMA